MCLSLRLRCLLLLNGGRQGDCVRVEFWLVEALCSGNRRSRGYRHRQFYGRLMPLLAVLAH